MLEPEEDNIVTRPKSTSIIDLRNDAELRARHIEINQKKELIQAQVAKQAAQRSADKAMRKKRETMMINAADITKNRTPLEAKIAEIDYRLNGSRARVNSGEFIPPRWVPDEEVVECILCRVEFDWVCRKHHCRHCGRVICGDCSIHRAMLPSEFGQNDPQRVCVSCYETLTPLQSSLTSTLANHQRVNSIDTSKCIRRHLNMPFSITLGSEIRKAAYSVYNLFETDNIIKDRAIPLGLLPNAKGVAFLTVVKAGFGLGGRVGTGLVVSRLPSGEWSAPTAIGTVGISWGLLIGGDITDYVIFLYTIDAVRAFAGIGQVSVGAGVEVAIGPVGRSGEANLNIGGYGYAPAFSYAHSRGLYAGMSLDGSVILSRGDVNHRFYGQRFTPMQILGGEVLQPRAAQPLYDALNIALSAEPNPQYYTVAQAGTRLSLPSSNSRKIQYSERPESTSSMDASEPTVTVASSSSSIESL